jgi:hypothetical protein
MALVYITVHIFEKCAVDSCFYPVDILLKADQYVTKQVTGHQWLCTWVKHPPI